MARALGYILLILFLLALLVLVADPRSFVRMVGSADDVEASKVSTKASGNEADPVVRKKRP